MMAEEDDAPRRRPTAKDVANRIADDTWSKLLRTASMVILLPVVGYLVIDKLNGIEKRDDERGVQFEKLQDTVGQIAANQSAGAAQRDAQQKQLDGLSSWMQRLADRINSQK
jgi:hypothetical protein